MICLCVSILSNDQIIHQSNLNYYCLNESLILATISMQHTFKLAKKFIIISAYYTVVSWKILTNILFSCMLLLIHIILL